MLEETFPRLANQVFWSNSVLAWIVTLVIAFLVYALVFGVLRFLGSRLQRRTEGHALSITTVLGKTLSVTRGTLFFLLTYAIALRTLVIPDSTAKILGIVAFAVAGIQIAMWLSQLVTVAIQHAYNKSGKHKANTVIVDLLTRAAQFVVWSFILIAVLDNAGVNVTTFIASLGIGGMAVAFAMQKILADLFASVAIGLDKPFEVGDYISFDGNGGNVERVGIKSTHIKALTGERLVVSNSKLTDSIVRNLAIRDERRVSFDFQIAYGATRDEVTQIVEGVSKIVSSIEDVRLLAAHLASFEESGLRFEVTYFVEKAGLSKYRDIHHDINLQIMDLLGTMGMSFAVPGREIRVLKDEGLAD